MEPEISADEMKARSNSSESLAGRQKIESVRREALPLIAAIERTFDSVLRPAITLHVARGFDDEWELSDERGRELAALDPERTWQEVDDDAIEKFHEYFSFADAGGWLFYLPAYMRHNLRRFPHGTDAAYWAICEDQGRKPEDQRLACLNEAQREVVSRYIAFCHEHA
jgi:hypothetical protein